MAAGRPPTAKLVERRLQCASALGLTCEFMLVGFSSCVGTDVCGLAVAEMLFE